MSNGCAGGFALRYHLVRLQPTGLLAVADLSGHYEFVVIDPGNYTVEYVSSNPGTNVLCPIGNSIAVNNVVLGNNRIQNNFYITRPPTPDLSVSLYDVRNASPGFPYATRVRYCNRGNTLASGTVEYDYNSLLGFQNIQSIGSQLTFHDLANARFTWSFSNLRPNECRALDVDFIVPTTTALGTPISGTARVFPVTGDATPSDNVDVLNTTVVGSYDPNDKQVGPYRTGNAWDGGAIYTTDNTLDYTIRFQNTGTAPATFVIVRDTLDVNLIPETLRELDSKHAMDVTVENGNILVFTFHNINLPDSSVSQEQSIGFIHFKIDRVAGLPVGTEISNQAAIYFDFNAPIFTNTPVSVIDEYTTVVELETTNFEVQAQPNPFERDLLVRYELSQRSDVHVKLFNQLGQCVYEQHYSQQDKGAQQVFIQTAKLNSGLYILQVDSNGQSSSKKLIKQ